MPNIRLPSAQKGDTMEETIENLSSTLYRYKKELEWLLANLDETNIVRMVSRNSDKVMLDRGGIMQSWGDSIIDNVDSVEKLRMDFYVPDDFLRIETFNLYFRLLPFRSYSKGALGGGSVSQTSGASSETTTTGFEDANAVYTDTTIVDGHKHQSLMLTTHSHGIEHTHQISLGNHTHNIDHGIYTSTSPAGVKVYVDGTLRLDNGGAGYNTDQANLNIKEWITTSGWHYVELSSSQLGRISCAYFTEMFISV